MGKTRSINSSILKFTMQIVFAHFGPKLPKYLVLNLRRTILLFPQHDIFLVTDVDKELIDVKHLNIFQYQHSEDWYKLESLLSHSKSFRSNFWFTSAARFVAIAEFSKTNNSEILHLESDVIISEDFPFEAMSKVESLFSFSVVNNSQAIASCLFIKNSAAAEYLSEFTILEAMKNHSTTDMYVLRELSKIKSADFQLLPSFPSQKNALSISRSDFLSENSSAISLFKGVFDAFQIGRYLFGDDPRNNRGFSVLRGHDSRAYLNVRKLDIITKKHREFPYVFDAELNTEIPIFSLHIHCKKSNLFTPRKIKSAIYKAVKNSKESPQKIFSLKIFISSIKLALVRRLSLVLTKL